MQVDFNAVLAELRVQVDLLTEAIACLERLYRTRRRRGRPRARIATGIGKAARRAEMPDKTRSRAAGSGSSPSADDATPSY